MVRLLGVSALLPPPCTLADTLPSPSCAILGPLPSTTPFHLALNHLYLADLPEYSEEGEGSGPHETALIITGTRASLATAIEEDDEDWMRERSGSYGVHHRLRRVHMRWGLLV